MAAAESDFPESPLKEVTLLVTLLSTAAVEDAEVFDDVDEEEETLPGGHLRGGSDSVLEVDKERLDAEPGLLSPNTPIPAVAAPALPAPTPPVS